MVRDEEMETGGDVGWPEEEWQGIMIVHESCHRVQSSQDSWEPSPYTRFTGFEVDTLAFDLNLRERVHTYADLGKP